MKPNTFTYALAIHGVFFTILIKLPEQIVDKSIMFHDLALCLKSNMFQMGFLWFTLTCFTMIFGSKKKKPETNHIGRVTSIERLRSLDWRQFEELMAEYYIHLGYSTTLVGGSGGDDGIDLWLKKGRKQSVVQCKHWKNKVGVSTIREMFAVMIDKKANDVIIVTTSYFTKEAINFAQGKPMVLIDGPALVDLIGQMPERKNQKLKSKVEKKMSLKKLWPLQAHKLNS